MIRRLLLVLSFGFFISSAQATMMLSGSIDSTDGGGIEATAAWNDGGAMLTWSVSQLQNGSWQYKYNFDVDRKEMSHIIFQVSDSFTADNILVGTTEGWELGLWGNEGGSNPGIPKSIYGLKFDDGSLFNSFTLVSDRAPMWGDFFAKDGKDGSNWVYAYNTNFGVAMDPYQDYAFGKILVPDTHTSQVPEPAPLALMGLGLIGLSASRRKYTS